jgi:hypothetical protein
LIKEERGIWIVGKNSKNGRYRKRKEEGIGFENLSLRKKKEIEG